jgi:hypothetical protein
MKAQTKTTYCPLTVSQKIVIVGAISLVINAVFAASPGDGEKSKYTPDASLPSAHQSTSSKTRLPEAAVAPAQDSNRGPDLRAAVSPEEFGCSASTGMEVQTFRNSNSESGGPPAAVASTLPGAPLATTVRQPAVPLCMQRVTITSNPCGARIYINGMQAGRTPISYPMPQGRYTLTLVAPGHQMYSRVILVPDGPLEVKANLVP